MPETRIAVIGAGNGGCAMAAYLALHGARVALADLFPQYLEGIRKEGGIRLSGAHGEGFARMEKVTTDVKEAAEGADLILVVTPAFTHELVAKALAPVLQDGQAVVLNPGRTAGALCFWNAVRKAGNEGRILVAETQTLIYACRRSGQCDVHIGGVKDVTDIASIPAGGVERVVELLHPYYPQFKPRPNALYTSMDNIGMLVHPAPVLFNIGWVESPYEFDYYTDGISPAIADFILRLDEERRSVAGEMGVELMDILTYYRTVYPQDEGKSLSLYELLHNNKSYKGIRAPHGINTRYVTDDVPTGMVPIADFGKKLGIATPMIDTVIDMANYLYKTDFRASGRTLQNLGLEEKSKEEIENIFTHGY